MLTDTQFGDASRSLQKIDDGKRLLRQSLPVAEYRALAHSIHAIAMSHEDYDAMAGKLWLVNATEVYDGHISSHPKDFVRFKAAGQGQGEWTNGTQKWPSVAVECHTKKYDPYGIKQCDLTPGTLEDRNTTIRQVYDQLSPDLPFYTASAPYYPWVEKIESVAAVCTERGKESRDFQRKSSVMSIFLCALGRPDLRARLAVALARPVARCPVRAEESSSRIAALTTTVQAEIVQFGRRRLGEFRELMASHGEGLGEFVRHGLHRYDGMSKESRVDFHDAVEALDRAGKDYLIIAMSYHDMRPLRNELPKIRYSSASIGSDGFVRSLDGSTYSSVFVTEDVCRLEIPSQNKTLERLAPVDLSGTDLHRFLIDWRPFAEAVQCEYIATHGDGVVKSPYVVCSTSRTRTFMGVSDQMPSKKPIGVPWTGMVNYRKQMFAHARCGIDVPPRHAGCIAARHTSASNDAADNSDLPPGKRRRVEREQALQSGHSSVTRATVYVDSSAVRNRYDERQAGARRVEWGSDDD